MNWDAATIIRIIVAALLVALLVTILPSCKTVDCLPETIVRDSIVTEYKLDSIYLYEKDSVFIKEKADTVFVNKYVTRYKDVMKIERDTIWQENKVVEVKEVLVEKPIAGVVKWLSWVGAFFVVLYLVKAGLWVYRKFFLKA
jgi:hypothetical protein